MAYLKKGDQVTYVPAWSRKAGPVIEAIVRRVHRDGSVSIEASFIRNPDGTTVPGWLGIKQRVSPDILARA